MTEAIRILLGVNIDHVATLRQARGTRYPDPVKAALDAEEAGADGITVHLREDRRHIQERDVRVLKEVLQTRMNFEMGVTEEMLAFAEEIRPAHSCLVPERREELTTEGGLDVAGQEQRIRDAVRRLAAVGTLNRYCSSGLQAIAIAANQIASGCSEVIVAGGVESITLTLKSVNTDHLVNPLLQREVPGIYYPMGQTAEIVARRYGITREAQDAYALQSQQRMARAQADGLFADEIVPMTTRYAVEDKASGEKQVLDGVVDRDDCNRPDTTLEGLASLKPAFAEDGSVTAGNASQLSDGASMTLLMSLEKALALGLEPKAFFRGFTVAGCEPDEMGIGPVFSVPKLLKAKGLKIADVDLWELNEAFASQCLYCRDRLEIDNEKYNVNGGSIAIGHPFGMTGSRQVGHLVRELRRRNLRYGVVTMCVGGGMGASGLFEAVR